MTLPPPAPPRTNYLLWGLLGAIVGLALIVTVLLLSDATDDPADQTETTTSAEPTATTAGTTVVSTTVPSTTASPATTSPAGSAFEGDTAAKTAEGDFLGTFALLDDIRFAQHDGFTRVVFDFEGSVVPWWSIAYGAGPYVDTADDPVEVAGTHFLEVLMSASAFDLSGAEVRITYAGEAVTVDTESVVEVVRIDDFEGVSTWVIGVIGEKPFSVGTLTGPPRIYVDIQD